eukprot:753322-Hanusia_phi.AAC.2
MVRMVRSEEAGKGAETAVTCVLLASAEEGDSRGQEHASTTGTQGGLNSVCPGAEGAEEVRSSQLGVQGGAGGEQGDLEESWGKLQELQSKNDGLEKVIGRMVRERRREGESFAAALQTLSSSIERQEATIRLLGQSFEYTVRDMWCSVQLCDVMSSL